MPEREDEDGNDDATTASKLHSVQEARALAKILDGVDDVHGAL